jgi:hypothetical protein
VPEEAGAKWDG